MKRKFKSPAVCGSVKVFLVLIPLVFTFFSQLGFAEPITIETSIPVGGEPHRALTVPLQGEVYITDWKDDTVSIINIKTDKITAPPLAVGSHPEAIARSPDCRRVYVGCQGSSQGQLISKAGVSIIDTGIRKVIKFIPLPDTVCDLAVTPNGEKIYAADRYAGLWKIDTTDYSASCVDPTRCPMSVVFTPNGEFAYVNYQCAPDPGTYGHDPIVVFDVRTDRPITAITHLRDGQRIANVGCSMAISPDGTLIWALGGNACSSDKEYDFEGCPCLNSGEVHRGRGIINIIDTRSNAVIEAKAFRGYDLGKDDQRAYELGASTATFFPDGKQIAVSTGSRILIYDTRTLDAKDPIEGMASAGNFAFSPDEMCAYVPMPNENCIRVLRLKPLPPWHGLLSWYFDQWKNSTGQMLGGHLAVCALLWACVSINFARTFAEHPCPPHAD